MDSGREHGGRRSAYTKPLALIAPVDRSAEHAVRSECSVIARNFTYFTFISHTLIMALSPRGVGNSRPHQPPHAQVHVQKDPLGSSSNQKKLRSMQGNIQHGWVLLGYSELGWFVLIIGIPQECELIH